MWQAWDEAQAVRLGAAIRALRIERGLSQEQLAVHAGITSNALHLLEAGRGAGGKLNAGPANPRFKTLHGLAGVLGTTVGELVNLAKL
jgi:transcriptional regulator with XRE-family HTH domain